MVVNQKLGKSKHRKGNALPLTLEKRMLMPVIEIHLKRKRNRLNCRKSSLRVRSYLISEVTLWKLYCPIYLKLA